MKNFFLSLSKKDIPLLEPIQIPQKEIIEYRSISEIADTIQTFIDLDPENLSFQQVFRLVNETFVGIVFPYYSLQLRRTESGEEEGYGLFRMVKLDRRIQYENDIRAPKENLVKKYGRCHTPGNSVTYCSNHITIPFFELNAKKDDEYILAKFAQIDCSPEIKSFFLGQRDIMVENSSIQIPQYRQGILGLSNSSYEKNKLLLEGISKIMRLPSSEGNYKKTSAVCLFARNASVGRVTGIFYPSVKLGAKGFNIAFESKAFNQKFAISSVEHVRFEGLVDDQLQYTLLRLGYINSSTGNIVWDYSASMNPIIHLI